MAAQQGDSDILDHSAAAATAAADPIETAMAMASTFFCNLGSLTGDIASVDVADFSRLAETAISGMAMTNNYDFNGNSKRGSKRSHRGNDLEEDVGGISSATNAAASVVTAATSVSVSSAGSLGGPGRPVKKTKRAKLIRGKIVGSLMDASRILLF